MSALTFKEQLQADIQGFLNPDEYGELMIIDGKEMSVIIDNNELLKRSGGEGYVQGVYAEKLLLFVSVATYGPKPKTGKILKLGTRIYQIADCLVEGGIYSMTLEATRV